MAKKRKVVVDPFSDEEVYKSIKTLVDDATKVNTRNVFTELIKGNLSRQQLIDKVTSMTGDSFDSVGTVVDTGLSVVGRQRILEVAEDLGLEWFRYVGGVIQTSREFCVERDGGYFHKEEVESWADEEWEGMIPGTNSENIFRYCGGYNCRHDLIPVAASSVPDEYKN